MKFFKPEDFADIQRQFHNTQIYIASVANAKLEREGKVVYSHTGDCFTAHKVDGHSKYKALLINISPLRVDEDEPIEKCAHPKEKIVQLSFAVKSPINHGFDAGMPLDKILYQCECGAQVSPTSFILYKVTND